MNSNINLKIIPERIDNNTLIFSVIEEYNRFGNKIQKTQMQYVINKQELIEDFIYKNLESNILRTMKCKIENELLQRKLKETSI